MAWSKLIGIISSGALVSVVAFAGNGCSSKTNGTTFVNDSGATDAKKSDSSSGSSGGSSGSSSGGGADGGTYDGTTGMACKTDADCHTATGPGVNACSNDVLFSGSLGDAALYPTPICIMPGTCDPLANGADMIAFCDGDPTNPASPGICYPTTNPPTAGKGTCFPQCQYKPDGTAAVGCQGTDVCQAYGSGTDSSGNPIGIGICYGGCLTDADCTSSGVNSMTAADTMQKCDALYGICTTTVTPPTLGIGAGCNATSTTATCDCISNQNNNLGYCSTFCKQGGPTSQCPTGWFCDTQEPTTVQNAMDATVTGWTMPNPGLGGFCAPLCNVDSGVADTDSGTCPSNASCQAGDLGGPACLPLQ
jgi:hypothetical protein